jgi:hypothetical protein
MNARNNARTKVSNARCHTTSHTVQKEAL